MNYFVSIESNYQHSWEIELLIQSFIEKGEQDNLYISVGLDDSMEMYDCKNLSSHNNKFYFKKANSNLVFNKWHSLLTFLSKKPDAFPITVLNPHNIFCSEISIEKQKIVCNEDPFFTYNKIKGIDLNLEENEIDKNWIRFGETIVFNNLPISFFEDILSYIKYFIDNGKYFKEVDRVALNLSVWKNANIFENKANIEIRPYTIESNMLENVIKNIINYDHGIQPSFSRVWFSKNDFLMHGENPILCLSKIRHTRCSDFIADIAKNYINQY